MRRSQIPLIFMFLVLIALFVSEPLTAQTSLDGLLQPYLSRYELPALAAGVVKDGKVIATGVVGIRRAGKTWDELITERIFSPLELKTAGLGAQASLGRIDAPLGHVAVRGKVKAFLAGPNGDNPAVIGPAGIAHMSILDFARWAGWNAGEGKRVPKLVRPETLRKLHTPVISMPEKKDAAPGTPAHGRYGLGWGQLSADWAPGPLLYHGGSNRKNLAHIWIDTRKDLAIVIATNIGGRQANEALLSLAQGLYLKFK